MAPADNDLKSQLSDIQKRLSEATFNTPRRGPSIRRENVLPQSEYDTNSSHTHPSPPQQSNTPLKPSNELHSKKSLTNFLSKKDKRVSLPVLDSSRSPSSVNKSSGSKDMDFVVGLSENLLVECRRLQAENQSKSTKLKSIEEEFSQLKATNQNLLSKLNEFQATEEDNKDHSWELELKLQTLTQEFKKVQESYSKAQKELNKHIDYSSDIRSELEELNLNKVTLEKELNLNKTANTNEIVALKDHVDELNDINSNLNDEIEELRRKLEESSKVKAPPALASIPILKHREHLDDEDEVFNEPPISPVKTISINNTALETETLKSSLSTAHQTIAKLRQQILKLRSSQLQGQQQQTPKKLSSPVSKKSVRSLNEPGNRSYHILANGNRSSRLIYEDKSDADFEDDDWENFEGDTSTYSHPPSSPTKGGRPLSTISNDLVLEDSDSDIDDTAEYAQIPLSTELQTISEYDVQEYAKQNGLVLVPVDEYQNLNEERSTRNAILKPAEVGIISIPNDNESTKEAFSDTELISKAKDRGLHVLPKQELDQYITLESDYELLQERYQKEAQDYKFQLQSAFEEANIGKEELQKLHTQIENPTQEYLGSSAKSWNLHLVPVSEFEDLKTKLNDLTNHFENPPLDYLRTKANSKDLKVIESLEHSKLLDVVNDLKSQVESHLSEKKNLDSKLDSLDSHNKDLLIKYDEKTKAHDEVTERHNNLSSSLQSEIKSREQLQRQLDEPSLDYIKQKASVLGLTAIDTSLYEKNLAELKSSIKYLKSELEVLKSKDLDSLSLIETLKNELGLLKDKDEQSTTLIKSLKSKIDSPSHDYLHSKALSNNLTLLETAKYSKEISTFQKEVSSLKDELEEELKKEQNLKDIIDSLNTKLENPSITYLRDKASAFGFKTIEATAYAEEIEDFKTSISSLNDDLKSQKEQYIKKLEVSSGVIEGLKKTINTVNIEKGELSSKISELKQKLDSSNGSVAILKSQIETPTHEYLSEKSNSQGLTTIPKLEHSSLLEKANRTISDLAKESGHVVLKPDEHQTLLEKANNPSVEHVRSVVKGHKVVPDQEYEDLIIKSNKTIDDHAKEKGLIVLGYDHHEQLTRKATSPTIEELYDHAGKHNKAVIDKEELSSLERKAARTVQELAEKASLVLLSEDDHYDLSRKAQSPTLAELAAHAKKNNSVLIDQNEHEELTTKAAKTINDLAKEDHKVLLSEESHAELTRKATKPTVDEIIVAAGSLGFAALTNTELLELKGKAEKTVQDLAKEENLVLVSQSDYKGLISPSIEDINKHAKTQNLVALPSAEYENLLEKSRNTAESLAAERNLVLVPHQEYENLINPDVKIISSNAEKLGLIAVAKAQHEKLVAASNAPTLEHITEKAKDLGYTVVGKAEYSELVSPSQDAVEKNAHQLGLVTVGQEEYTVLKTELARLKKDLTNQDLLVQKVSSEGNVVLTQESYDKLLVQLNTPLEEQADAENKVAITKELHESLINPSKDKLAQNAAKLNLVVIHQDDHNTLVRNVDAPSIDHLKSKASAHGHIVVDKEHYETIKSDAETPSLNYLVEKAKTFDSIIVKKSELQELQSKANKPLKTLAEENEKVVLTREKVNELEHPSTDAIIKLASAVGLVTLPTHEVEELQNKLENPDLEFLSLKAAAQSHVLISTNDFESLKSPTVDELTEKLAARDLSVITPVELNDLKAKAGKSLQQIAEENEVIFLSQEEYDSLKSPSKENLLAAISGIGLITLTKSEHRKLSNPDKDSLERFANAEGLVLLKEDQYQDLSSKAKPLEELAKEQGLSLLPKSELEALKNPDVYKVAQSAGLIALTQQQYDDLKSPSASQISSLAEKSGLVVLPQAEFSSLKAQSEKSIHDLATESQSIVLSRDQHEKLLRPDQGTIIDHAAKHGLVTLSTKDHHALSNPGREILTVHAEREGLKILSKIDFEALSNPSKELLEQYAVKSGGVFLSDSDYTNLTSLEHAKELSENNNLTVLGNDAYESLVHPSKDAIKKLAKSLDLATIDISEYDALINPSRSALDKLAGDRDLVLLETSTYNDISTKASRSIEDLAKERKMSVIPETEYLSLLSPSVEDIEAKAREHGYIAIPVSSHKELLSPSRNTVEDHALKHGLIAINASDKDAFVDEHLNTKEKVAIDKSTYAKLTADISREELNDLNEKFNLKAIEKESLKKLTSQEGVIERAKEFDLVALPRQDLEHLKAKAEQPDKETIEEHAAIFGCVVIGKKEYEVLQNYQLKPSKADLEAKAIKIDHVLVPKADYEEYQTTKDRVLLAPSTPKNKFAATKDYFETVSKSAEKDSQTAKVFASAKSLGFVPVAADEYKHLIEHQRDHVITKSDIYKGAKDFNLSVLPTDEYKLLLKSRSQKDEFTLADLQAYASRWDLKLVEQEDNQRPDPLTLNRNSSASTFTSFTNESDYTDALSRVPSDASTINGTTIPTGITVDELRFQANNLGYSIVPIAENLEIEDPEIPELHHDDESIFDNANDEADDGENTEFDTILLQDRTLDEKDSILQKASDHGLVVIDQAEYNSLVPRTFSKAILEARADELGLRILEENDYQALESWKTPQQHQVIEAATSLGLIALTSLEFDSAKEEAASRAISNQILDEKAIVESGEKLGLKVLPSSQYQELLQGKVLSKDQLVSELEKYDLVAVSKGDYESLSKNLEATARKLDDVTRDVSTRDKLSEEAENLGLVLIDKSEYARLLEENNDNTGSGAFATLSTVIPALGISQAPEVSQNSNERSLDVKELTKEDVLVKSEELGLVTLSSEEYESLLQKVERKEQQSTLSLESAFTKDDLVSRGNELGLTVIPSSEYQRLTAEFGLLSKSDVVQKALEYDLVAVSREELNDLRVKAGIIRESDTSAVDGGSLSLTKSQVESSARDYGLLAIPENAFVATNISRIPDVNNVVVLPVTYYNKLTKSETFNIDKVSNDEIQAQARKRGFHVVYGDVDLKAPSISRNSTVTSLSSSNSRKNLAEAATIAANQELDNHSRISRSSSKVRGHSASRSGSVAPISNRELSVDGGLSLLTTASLSEPNIIPALTQTVIGEYLFKYYRRLGPLSSISESRHERYFWIHPYTMTLYWSSTNPVLGNPSSHRTRAAAIVGVESVNDNTPLPAGLYYKSIIVHSQTRSIKITCPTRQRHNIWYNSLRYLIQRNMDGIELDEDFDLLQDRNRF